MEDHRRRAGVGPFVVVKTVHKSKHCIYNSRYVFFQRDLALFRFLPLPSKSLVEIRRLRGENEPMDVKGLAVTFHDGIGELGIVKEPQVIADSVSITTAQPTGRRKISFNMMLTHQRLHEM